MTLSGCGVGFCMFGCVASVAAIVAPAPPLSGGFIAGSFADISMAALLSDRLRRSLRPGGGGASEATAPAFAAASRAALTSA